MAIRVHPSVFVHPGLWLKHEVVDPAGLTVSALADRLHVTRQALSTLLNGRAGLSAEMALRFEQAFGLSADTLMRMQGAHALAAARTNQPDFKIEPVQAAA